MRISLPEQAWIDYRPASFASRAAAYVLDFIIRWSSFAILALIVLKLTLMVLGRSTAIWPAIEQSVRLVKTLDHPITLLFALMSLVIFAVSWGYIIFFEVRRDGVTPGKKLIGLRVVTDTGLPLTLRSSALRTIFLAVDLLPGIGFIGLVSIFFSRRSQRLGDLVARTQVVYDFKAIQKLSEKSELNLLVTIPPRLYAVIENYLLRLSDLSTEARATAVRDLLILLNVHLETPPDLTHSVLAKKEEYLRLVFRRLKPAKETKDKIAVSTDWEKIKGELDRSEAALLSFKRQGTNRSPAAIQEMAAGYQALCNRYSELSTFYSDTSEAKKAAELVRLGRRIIYGTRLENHKESVRFFDKVHAGYRQIRVHIAFALITLVGSALICALLVDINPNFGWHFLTEEVVSDLKHGKMWTESIQGVSSLASSKIMTNNINVALMAFAFGIAGGFGTVLLLIFNGAMIGGMFMALAQYNMAPRLLEFIVAHGVLELSVIAVSGAAGIALGDALLRPGFDTRLAAMQKQAQSVFPVLLFSALCLIPAGIVEGYVSPYDQIPLLAKLVVGLTLGGGYWLALFGIRR